MTSQPLLALAYVERRPEDAARVLEDLEPGDAAAFIDSVPADLAASVVVRMAPWSAARAVELLAPERAAGLIRAMPQQEATSVLRLIERERLAAVLKHVPKRLARSFRLSLEYPKATVGAWMQHSVPTLAQDETAGDALKFATKHQSDVDSHVFVVDQAGRFLGAVGVGRLLRSDPEVPLSEMMDCGVRPLSNRALLGAVASLPDWDSYPVLPVVGRRHNVLGGLARSDLRRGLAEETLTHGQHAAESVLSHLVATYLVTCSAVLRLVLQPGRPRQSPLAKESDRGRKPR